MMVEATHSLQQTQRQTMPSAERLSVCVWRCGSKPSVEQGRGQNSDPARGEDQALSRSGAGDHCDG